jgi:glutamate/tyrosine decarboxylase-like PLP-dependent enzyme
MNYRELLEQTCCAAADFLDGVEARPVGRPVDFGALVARMGGPLPQEGSDPRQVIECLRTAADAGLVATAGPRYFGFVVGGALPAAVAAEWLTAAWDQNAFLNVLSPAAAAVEEVVRTWLVDLFGLPPETSAGFTSGATMANFVALAAARHALYRKLGWNVEELGLLAAPPITVITSDESHASIFASLQMLGLGYGRVTRVAADGQGRMRADALRAALATARKPVVVCAQAGNVNTGAFDPLAEIADLVHNHAGWLHVDGAFGAWAAASHAHAGLTAGLSLADSLTVDCHKWLNVPQDSGLVFVRDRAAHRAAMTMNAPYFGSSSENARENHNWVPEASRRARGFAVYAALRSLGRNGLAELVERTCRLARRMADQLRGNVGVQILNEVVLNQVLVRFSPADGGDADAFTAEVIRRVQEDGTCWLGGTTWQGQYCMRISVSNWSTAEADIDESARAIRRCAQ